MSTRDSTAAQLQRYYTSLESRIGYRVLLGGARHFGWYPAGSWNPFPITPALRRMEDVLAARLHVRAGDEVLDAGCGAGFVASRVASTTGAHVQAVDIVAHHVAKARATARRSGVEALVTVQHDDYHDLSAFTAQRFDALYTMETFVHAHTPALALGEFFRVLAPGGRLVMHEYDHVAADKMPAAARRAMREVNELSAMPAAQAFDEGVLEALVESAGFVDVRLEDVTAHVAPLAWLFFAIAYVPYLFVKLLGLQRFFVNAVAGVEATRLLKDGYARYVIVTATKPAKT